MNVFFRIVLIFFVVFLASCSYISPHKLDVEQGNLIEQEQVDLLKLGLTKEQVLFLLGTPIVKDIFHENRWDYLYYLKKAEGGVEQHRLSVFFRKNKVIDFQGDTLPKQTEALPKQADTLPKQTEVLPKARKALNDAHKISHTKENENQQHLIEALRKRLLLWQKFWMEGNVEQYIAMYTKNYSPSDKNRQQWIENREKLVTSERNIQVAISNEKIQLINKQLAKIAFEQVYQSNHYQDKVRKQLYWKKINNEWYIHREVAEDIL